MYSAYWRYGATVGAVLALASCQMGNVGSPFGHGQTAAKAVPGEQLITVVGGSEKDVETPSVFNLSGKALWDGRPSLGGVWVAHSSVKDPERVIIRNPANGRSVIGALFRREIDNPGPSIQLSSDAAEALGLLAGQPGTISIVALRTAQPAAPATVPTPTVAANAPATDGQAAGPAAKGAKPAKIDQKTLEASAAAAIDKATKGTATKGTATKGTATGTPTPKAGVKPAPQAGTKAAAGTSTKPTAQPAPAATKPAAAPATTAPGGVTAQRPYLQIGIFSVEANAKKAAAQMTKAGLAASVKPDQSQGKTFWRVIIGPVATVAERDAAAAKVKALGYPDSYPVSK